MINQNGTKPEQTQQPRPPHVMVQAVVIVDGRPLVPVSLPMSEVEHLPTALHVQYATIMAMQQPAQPVPEPTEEGKKVEA